MTNQTNQDFYDIDAAISSLQAAEAHGFTGTHACMSSDGWRHAGHLTIEQAEHLIRDGQEADDYLLQNADILAAPEPRDTSDAWETA